MDAEKFIVYFEEIRFALELLIANHMFSRLFSPKRENYRTKVVISTVFMCVLACFYPMLIMKAFVSHGDHVVIEMVLANAGWYIFLTLMSGLIIQTCYKQSMADSVFICAMGYALQHLEFVLINEWLAKGTWVELSKMVPLYITICICTTIIQYSIVYKVFHHFFEDYKGVLFEDNRQNFVVIIGMLILLIICSFVCQNIFCSGRANYENINYQGAIVDIIDCIMVLTVGFFMSRISSLNKEKDIVEQLLYERKRQYELSKENIAVINSKCHDLKHQIKALETVDAHERKTYIHELGKAIDIYDHVLNTGNEVVDTILSEKSLNCEKRNIRLSCICDAKHLDFMSILDIYALLGNALDNAIETVSKYKDENKRVISLSIKAVGDFLSIQTENYCEKEPDMVDGLPTTIKRNKAYHGYGMKSMKHIAKKYGGSLVCGVKNNSFTLQILLPMPPEFLRLYDLREQENSQL